MKIHKVVMMLRRVQYQEVVFSEEEGNDMPKTANELVKMAQDIKNNPLDCSDNSSWAYEEPVEITSFDVIEEMVFENCTAS